MSYQQEIVMAILFIGAPFIYKGRAYRPNKNLNLERTFSKTSNSCRRGLIKSLPVEIDVAFASFTCKRLVIVVILRRFVRLYVYTRHKMEHRLRPSVCLDDVSQHNSKSECGCGFSPKC